MKRRSALGGGLAVMAMAVAACVNPVRSVYHTATGVVLLPYRVVDRALLRSVVRNPIQAPSPQVAAKSPTRVPLGVQAPSFELSDALGETFRTEDFRDAPVLIVTFLSNRCPLAKHVSKGLADFAKEYQKRGVITVAINPNDPARYPEDSIENIAAEVAKSGLSFPYLIDVKQEVARAFLAAWTPDFYVFDRERKLAYQGQFDDSRPGNGIPVTGGDLRTAVDALLSNADVPSNPKQSVGCGIAWKPGNEPRSTAKASSD